MSERIYNFSAGPAVLPLEVLEIIRDNLFSFQGSGLGVMELSHRGPHFEAIIAEAEASLRRLLSLSDNYAVIFTTGGATNQFSMVPMNLLGPSQTADYLVTGVWAKKAYEEAIRFGDARVAASTESISFKQLPDEVTLSNQSAYLHYTSNNTVIGTQFKAPPEAANALLVCDASSDFLHAPMEVEKHGLIYSGSQKNIGPAGVTVVIIRKDLLERSPDNLPLMMDYRTYVESGSLYNTPPTFPIFVVGEVLKWLENLGGLAAMGERNRRKAAVLYDLLDKKKFYHPLVDKRDRSVMNVTFRLADTALEETFIIEAEAQGLNGLRGHRLMGGMRASIYNAFPETGVTALVDFMDEFERRFG